MNEPRQEKEYPWLSTKISAVLFDMDGTLVDSEIFTGLVVEEYLRNAGLATADVDFERFHGVTWEEIAQSIHRQFSQLTDKNMARTFQKSFHDRVRTEDPQQIPGAIKAVGKAAQYFDCAIVSSSNRATVDYVVEKLGFEESLKLRVCAEDVTKSKPNPQCYQQAAQRLGLTPEECLVFEDSIAGLTAAKNGGMWTVAINHRKGEAMRLRSDRIAHYSVLDFEALSPGFFEQISNGIRP